MTEFGTLGYALVGALYVVLTTLLLTVWRGRKIGGYLIAAGVMSVIWSGVLALQATGSSVQPVLLFAVEILRTGAWIAFPPLKDLQELRKDYA